MRKRPDCHFTLNPTATEKGGDGAVTYLVDIFPTCVLANRFPEETVILPRHFRPALKEGFVLTTRF